MRVGQPAQHQPPVLHRGAPRHPPAAATVDPRDRILQLYEALPRSSHYEVLGVQVPPPRGGWRIQRELRMQMEHSFKTDLSGIRLHEDPSATDLDSLAYTRGADIGPVKGRWLWIPTPEIQRLAGSGKSRRRVTPGNWRTYR